VFRLKITLGTGRPARNVASARLHLGDFPQAGSRARSRPRPVWGSGRPAAHGVKRWPVGVLLAGGSGSGPPRAGEDLLAAPRSR